ncbi:MAG: LTA synthase family protein [Bacteroidaceae bacterium]|nr:LTA synthase family protein [Bacteroidaceae bacterium]
MKKSHTSSWTGGWGRIPLLFLWALIVFAVGKLIFMRYNADIEPFTWANYADVLRHGLSMDVSTTCYLLLLPWLVCLAAVWRKQTALRRWLRPYWWLVAVLVVLVIATDCVMYAFWKFKLNAIIFAYIDTSEAGNSVQLSFLVTRLLALAVAVFVVGWTFVRLTPKRLKGARRPIAGSLFLLLLGGLLLLGIRGGVGVSNMNVGKAYYSQTLFLNHSAVNPVFSLLSSIKRTDRYGENYNYLTDEELAQTFAGLFPADTEDVADSLLRVRRPNVLVVLMESFGGMFVEELGGAPGVAPHFSRLIGEGVFWDNYYSNSFRTDRGTVSAYSGWVSYPDVSLMRIASKRDRLPSLAHSLVAEGYTTDYLYGGDIDVMDKKAYLVGSGYQTLTSDKDFSHSEAHNTKWGAPDSLTALRCFRMIASKPTDRPWHFAYQTLSSHEPWEVPYHRLQDPVLNAFAYTDQCVGQLVDSLKTLPEVWDRTLVILIPDHGVPYNMTYENPAYFHSPMLWLGGAIRRPRVMHTILNQSDLVATLLSQMGIGHRQYPWSRNVLSKHYTEPFAYSTFPSGIMFRDSTGVTIFDVTSHTPIAEQPAPSADRLRKAKAILQTTYDQLDEL